MVKLTFDTIEKQASYGIGLQVGQQLIESGLQELQIDALVAGLRDMLTSNEPAVPVDVVHRALREFHEQIYQKQQDKIDQQKEKEQHYLQENRQREGVQVTDSGLQFEVLTKGSGDIPKATDTVRVHYQGQLINGTIFDSSIARCEAMEFPVNAVIAGWSEALTMMPVGSKWRLVIPENLAYGEKGAGKLIPPFSTLIFEVELLDII